MDHRALAVLEKIATELANHTALSERSEQRMLKQIARNEEARAKQEAAPPDTSLEQLNKVLIEASGLLVEQKKLVAEHRRAIADQASTMGLRGDDRRECLAQE